MISNFSANIAALVRPTTAQQSATAERTVAQNGAGNLGARDTLAKREQGKRAAQMISAQRGTYKVAILPQKVATKKKA